MKKYILLTAMVSGTSFSGEFYPTDDLSVFASLAFTDVSEELTIDIIENELTFADISFAPLYSYYGAEDNCDYISLIDQFICIEDRTIYLEESSLNETSDELKIGGTLGKAIGKITNPIKDNVTKPLWEDVIGGQKGAICGFWSAATLANVAYGYGPTGAFLGKVAFDACK